MNKENGGPAYPSRNRVTFGKMTTGGHIGMTLRDYFAGQALDGLSAHVIGAEKRPGETNAQAHARVAYSFADAMLAERAK